MNSTTISKWSTACLIGAALVSAPIAMAGPSAPSPEMQRALAKAAQGPEALRRYVERTKPIYMLDYTEVMLVLHPDAMAATDDAVIVAKNDARQ
jgi:hypothetical protein